MTAIPPSHRDLLESRALAFVATTSRHQPNVSPTWCTWDPDRQHLIISLTDRRQKYRNLLRDPAVAVCVLDCSNPYRYVELRGAVVSMTDDVGHKLISSLAERYVGARKFAHDPSDGRRLVVRIEAEYVRSFG